MLFLACNSFFSAAEIQLRTSNRAFFPNSRVSNRPDLGGTVPILTENPESRLDLGRDAKCRDFEKQRSCSEVIGQKNSLNGIFRVILW